LAARDGLFLFHFEHRVPLDLPEHWGLGEPSSWEVGVLRESKYQAFRHDQLCGGFHPGHRAKWSSHELCHGLVGFAWRPGATPFFHATAGRLAELLPVALYYFFDEAFLRRCPVHAGEGALFRAFCPACEAAATRPDDEGADAARWIADGLRYLDRELAAIERTRRSGAVVPHRFATLDLASDGVAYAEAHAARLGSDAFDGWVRRFAPDGVGRRGSLEALQARVEEVALAILGEGPAPERSGDASTWTVQDVGWRLEVVREETEGEARAGMDRLLEALASSGDLGAAADAYEALNEEWELAPPDALWAVGYGVEALRGRPNATLRQLSDGVGSCAPGSLQLAPRSAVADLAALDRSAPVRDPLVERWRSVLGGVPAELAKYEAALATVGAPTGLRGPGADGRVRLAEGVRLVRSSLDVVELAGAVERGDYDAEPPGPCALAVVRAADGDVALVELDPEAAAALAALPAEGGLSPLDPETTAALFDLGILEPMARAESWTS
jgi:hypothetical protein